MSSLRGRFLGRYWVVVLGVVCLFASVEPGYGFSGSGSGTEGDPYIITDVNQLQEMDANLTAWYELGNDINASVTATWNSGAGFDPIGNNTYYFNGSIDGKGHIITDLYINRPSEMDVGLFSIASWNSDGSWFQITNITLERVNITGQHLVGGLAGYAGCRIQQCYVTGSVQGTGDYVGGLIGVAGGVVINSYAETSVIGNKYVGGFTGSTTAYLLSCYATGNVQGYERAVGGLAGRNSKYIDGCYAIGDVQSTSNDVGGLVGHNSPVSPAEIGIAASYAAGSVLGKNNVGGLVGRNEDIVINSYSVGSVTGDGNDVGGLIGIDSGTCSDSFWDTESSGEPNSAYGTGKTTAQMQTKSTFTDAGWDFVDEAINGTNDIWRLCIDGIEYPKLSWQFPTGDFTCPDGVTLPDFSILASAWYTDPNLPNWNPVCDISDPNDNFIDELDLGVFTDNYLTGF